MLARQYRTDCGGIIEVHPKAAFLRYADENFRYYLVAAIQRIRLPNQDPFEIEIDFGETIGKSECVETAVITEQTVVDFAIRRGKHFPSRIVLQDAKLSVSSMTLIARRLEPKRFRLVSAYFGSLSKREPWDRTHTETSRAEAIQYWCRHALIYSPTWMLPPQRTSWANILQSALERDA